MIKGEKDKLLDLAKNNVCAEHHLGLEVVWDDELQENVIKCIKGHYPAAITRIQVEGRKVFDKGAAPLQDNLSLVPKADLGTGELLLPETIQALIHYAHKYELDPYRGHVILMYGKPYITLDGYLWHANRTNLPYKLISRPLSDNERKIYQIGEDDHAWEAKVIKEPSGSEFVGLGIVTQEEMTAKAKGKPEQLRSPVVAAHPQQLAQKRAEWQALRRAFPIGEEKERKNADSSNTSSTEVVED